MGGKAGAGLNTYHVEVKSLYILDVSFGSGAAYVYFETAPSPTPYLIGAYSFLAMRRSIIGLALTRL